MKTSYQKILQIVGGEDKPSGSGRQCFPFAPRALADFYSVCGGHELCNAYHSILPLQECFQVESSMVFATGSQGAMLWSVPMSRKRMKDSPVFCHVRCGRGWEAYEENTSCFEFLKGFLIWNAIFGLRDSVSQHFSISSTPTFSLPSGWDVVTTWDDVIFFMSGSALGCLMNIQGGQATAAADSNSRTSRQKFSLTARSVVVCQRAVEEITCLTYAERE